MAFNTRISEKVEALATECNVPIRKHNIIYRLVDDVKVSLPAANLCCQFIILMFLNYFK